MGTNPYLIDTHTHIYLDEFGSEYPGIIDRARAKGVEKFYLPGIDSSVIKNLIDLADRYPGVCCPMMGLHPGSVKENYLEELAVVESWLSRRPFAAVGEIGLDFYWSKIFEVQQIAAFRLQIEWALAYNLPIVIHTRGAMTETINIVREYSSRGLKGIFHCFGDTYAAACDIIDAGFYLGIGGVITYKNSGLASVLEKVNLEHLVVETDAPYLSPHPLRKKRNEPANLTLVVEKLAEVKNVPSETVAFITSANAQKIFAQ